MSFFNKNFNKEDLLLYIITICLLFFLGWYFKSTQEQLVSSIDYRLDHIKTEEIKILEAAKMRYEFAGKVLISNSTRTNLSFLIGSIMCLLGTLIIIRKARVDTLEASGGDENLSFSIKTTSPGIFLAVLGTMILIFSITFKDKYTVTDNDSIQENTHLNQQENGKKEPTGNEINWDDE